MSSSNINCKKKQTNKIYIYLERERVLKSPSSNLRRRCRLRQWPSANCGSTVRSNCAEWAGRWEEPARVRASHRWASRLEDPSCKAEVPCIAVVAGEEEELVGRWASGCPVGEVEKARYFRKSRDEAGPSSCWVSSSPSCQRASWESRSMTATAFARSHLRAPIQKKSQFKENIKHSESTYPWEEQCCHVAAKDGPPYRHFWSIR